MTTRPFPLLAALLLVQAALGGMLVGDSVTTILVLAVTLYAAGRYAEGTSGLAGAAAVAVVLAYESGLVTPGRPPG